MNKAAPLQRILVIGDDPVMYADFHKIFALGAESAPGVPPKELSLLGGPAPATRGRRFHLDFAATGQEGLEILEHAIQEDQPYAMAFVNTSMRPGWDRVETIAQLWEASPALQVVICTADMDDSQEGILRELGHSDRLVILCKPFSRIAVLQLARALTAKWQLFHGAKSKTTELERHVAERTSELRTANAKLRMEIAERIKAEQNLRQSQKLEAIGQLAGGVAHDFNNMLTVIRGYTQLLLADEALGHQMRGPLQQMDGAAERAANLTRQLLAFSRKQVLQPELVNLNEIIHSITKMLNRILGEDITLRIEGAPDGAGVVADRGAIEQVLLNLVVNARDAMPRGGRLLIRTSEVEFTSETGDANARARVGKFVCLNVADRGCGMGPEILPRIFEPFFTTKEVGKGTGLGLATVYGIVKQHKGWIEVESAVNQGTTFQLFFPACNLPAPPAFTAGPPASIAGGNEVIFLVEDEPALRKLTRTVLQRYGYHVITAVSGADALKVWPEHAADIDLLLTDMVMPDGISGFDLAQRLLAQKTGMKVIYTTGYSLEMADRDAVLLPGDHFLPKPYTPEKLATMVRDCLDAESARPA